MRRLGTWLAPELEASGLSFTAMVTVLENPEARGSELEASPGRGGEKKRLCDSSKKMMESKYS